MSTLVNYSYSLGNIHDILQSDSINIMFLGEWNYQQNIAKNIFVFDTITYKYSALTGVKYDESLYYTPKDDITKYLQQDCWNNSSSVKLATTGSWCEYLLVDDLRGYKIVFAYYTKKFKEEIHPQEIIFYVYKNSEIVNVLTMNDFNNILSSNIKYFKTNDAIFFYHYYGDSKIEAAEYLSRISFEKLIP